MSQDKPCTFRITMKRFRESLWPWKSNKYYIYLCECANACVRACVGARDRGRVRAHICLYSRLSSMQRIGAIL
jgi:hypothetical protein